MQNIQTQIVPLSQSSKICCRWQRPIHLQTGLHLQVYGDIGELFAAITHGVKLHKNYAQGSDSRLGNDFIEVKTITPF